MRRYWCLVPLYVAVAAFPLIFDFARNLEYEYTLCLSYLALVSLPLAGLFFRPSYVTSFQSSIPMQIIWTYVLGPFCLLLPAVLFFALGICPCSKSGFGFWFFIQAYPSVVLAQALFFVVLKMRLLGFSKTRIFWAGAAIYAALIVAFAASYPLAPQVRRIDLLAGFIHGPIYDNWIAIDAGVALARLAHLFLASVILSLTWVKRRDPLTISLSAAMAVCWIACAVMAASFPSVATGKKALDELLSQTMDHPHFQLHFRAPEAGDLGKTQKRMQKLFDEAAFHISELRVQFGEDSPFVHIYVYPDEDSKKLWFGGGATDVTDVFTPSIHVTYARFPHPTLRHELVHALASEFGYYGLGFHPNMAFTEGLAVALAPEEDDISLDDGSAALIKSGRLPKLANLFSPFFWKESGSRSYTVAGSIIGYLINQYGFESVRRLYAGEDWDKVFKESRKAVLEKWGAFVLAGYRPDTYELYAESLFRYPGLLRALCPHSKADLRRRQDRSPYIRLRQPIGWDPDKNYWKWRTQMDPGDRYALVSLWSSEIASFAKGAAPSEGKITVWRDALRNARLWPPKTLEDLEMAITESDLTRLLGDRQASMQILRQIDDYAGEKGIGLSLTRQVRARLMIEEAAGDEEAMAWRKYLAGWRTTIPESTSKVEPWIFTYLRLRNADAKVFDVKILNELVAIEPDETLPPTFKQEWFKYLGFRLIQLEAYSSAEDAFKRAARFSSSASRKYFEMLARQAKFYREKKS